MRLLLLPLTRSGSHIILYAHRPPIALPAGATLPYHERILNYTAKKWHEWEHSDTTWQLKVTAWGNGMFKRLPYQEWGLKSLGPRREGESAKVEVQWPRGLVEEGKVMGALGELGGEERRRFHLRRLVGTVVGMPITAPFAVIPIIPNLPFFFLCFRAWSHWKAREGSKHLDYLLSNQLTTPQPSDLMLLAYQLAILDTSIKRLQDQRTRIRDKIPEPDEPPGSEELLLAKKSGKIIADALEVPALEEEIERAIWQVKRSLQSSQKVGSGAKGVPDVVKAKAER